MHHFIYQHGACSWFCGLNGQRNRWQPLTGGGIAAASNVVLYEVAGAALLPVCAGVVMR
jgi:hypothetical protein